MPAWGRVWRGPTAWLALSLSAALMGLLVQAHVSFDWPAQGYALAALGAAAALAFRAGRPWLIIPSQPLAPGRGWSRGVLLGLRSLPIGVALLSALFFSTGTSLRVSGLRSLPEPIEPYGLLADGFIHGRLGLIAEPAPQVLALKDPYAPSPEMDRFKIRDVILFQGHYYLMHGPLPVLALYLPVYWLTGRYTNTNVAVAVFGLASFLFLYLLMVGVKDAHFQGASELWVLAGGLSLGLGGISDYLMTRPWIYETCIASSAAFMAAAVYFYFVALEQPALSAGRLAWASSLAALAALGRPNCIVGGCALALGTSVLLWARPAGPLLSGGLRMKALIALWLPLLAAALLWAAYDQARFGSPFDFGLDYVLSGIRMKGSGFFSASQGLEDLWANLKIYLLQPYRALGSFPYVGAYAKPIFGTPKTFYGEEVIGFFALWPAAWLVLALPAALALSPARHLDPLPQILGLLGLLALSTMAILFILSACTFRYAGDFFPYLIVLQWAACLLLCALPLRAGLKAAVAAVYSLSTVHGILVSVLFALHGVQGCFDPYSAWIGAALGLGPR